MIPPVTYRSPAEREKPPAPSPDDLRCERCDIRFPPSDDPRCPQCLRRTTVVDPRGLGIAEREAPLTHLSHGATGEPRRVVWPHNDTCPICGERDVGDAAVFLRITKMASGAGTLSAGLLVRVRSCGPCRDRIGRLELMRYAGAVGVIVGMALSFAFFVGTAGAIATGCLGVALFAGSLGIVGGRNRRARAVLDASGLTAELAELVPAPSGLFEHEHWALHARLPEGREAIDLPDALRVARRRFDAA
jgi:RNA polymerase subunit RPABC4/transcription elongation factor Spt4